MELMVLFLIGLVFALFSIIYWTFRLGISPMPSSYKVRKALKTFLPKEYEGTIYDLGSGFGHMLYFFKRRYPKALIVGYEISFIPYIVSKCLFAKSKNVVIKKEDFSLEKLPSGIIYIYLFSKGMRKLDPKLFEGSLVISNTFQFSFPHSYAVKVRDCYHTHLYVYDLRNL